MRQLRVANGDLQPAQNRLPNDPRVLLINRLLIRQFTSVIHSYYTIIAKGQETFG